ncbi:MAGUK p55 subfamily member 7-like [Salvelinus fontinalis]|uniref:MAGUK p55 subfamily member 7-like n=1 Tax=Salvelinus fontinalis TaxID=8038 RepID=UPI002485D426|nr:MAGUK p55 subfamily member 7-like [Salvelinus fontinalis]
MGVPTTERSKSVCAWACLLTPFSSTSGVFELLSLVISGMKSIMDRNEDFTFLKSMIMERRFHLLVKIHARLRRFGSRNPVPVRDNAKSLACNLAEELWTQVASAECSELISLLSNPHIKGLLSVHDIVAQKGYDPELPPLPDNIEEEDEDSVKIISLFKSQEPLGATIKRDESTGAIVVARIMRGGAADRSGLIHEGDELREVNGVQMEDKTPEEIIPIMAQSQGEVTFKVIPVSGIKEELSANETMLFVRSLFDYNPEEDPAIPCRQAGLGFKRGDILQIVNQEDDTWWQACRHGDSNSRAGLIPSRQLQERRVALQRPKALFKPQRVPKKVTVVEDADYGAITGIHIAGLRRSFRLGRRGGRSGSVESKRKSQEMGGATQTPTYLEVAPYCRDPKEGRRLVLLVGPSGVGLSEMKRRLLLSDPDHYGVTVPHTTREKRKQEKDGVEYHFVSRQTFEMDIVNHKFLEYGDHRGNYYGTSLESVHKVIREDKVCLLDVQPHTVQRLHTTEFKPCVVFVKPPSIQELRFSRRKATFISTQDMTKLTKTFSEEDFEDMISSAEAMDSQYGHLFEMVVVNGDFAVAFNKLRAELEKLETEAPQWIPVEWTSHTEQNTESLC